MSVSETAPIAETATPTARVPLVEYLVLEPEPHLRASACTSCGARYFDRRNACASCFATSFAPVDIATEGTLRSFTIVSMAAPGIATPFVAGVVDCDGTSVRGNVVNTPPDPEHVTLGMRVRLVTTSVGVDSHGTEAVGYGFQPV